MISQVNEKLNDKPALLNGSPESDGGLVVHGRFSYSDVGRLALQDQAFRPKRGEVTLF